LRTAESQHSKHSNQSTILSSQNTLKDFNF
jgi:hypothetical protein